MTVPNGLCSITQFCKQFCEHSEIRAFVKSGVLPENYGCVNIINASLQYYCVSLMMECLSKHSFRYNYISLPVYLLVILSLYTSCYSVAKPNIRVVFYQ